jgi:hypothetical protein
MVENKSQPPLLPLPVQLSVRSVLLIPFVFFLISISNFTFTLQGFTGNGSLLPFQLEHDAALLILQKNKGR